MREKDKYIGVFDSGVGGLTVVKNIIEALPYEKIVYLGDSKHMPYGNKTKEQIIQYVLKDVEFLNNYELKAIVIACNTADGVAKDALKAIYKQPIFGVIDPAAKKACEITINKKIGVIATSAATNSKEYEKCIHNYNKSITVYSQACPFLAPMIEKGNFNFDNQDIRIMLEEYLTPLIENEIDTLILGCTHYDLLYDIVADMYPQLQIVSSSKCITDIIQNELVKTDNMSYDRQYFCTSDCDKFEKVASLILPDIKIKEV